MEKTYQELAFKKIIFFLDSINEPIIMKNINDNIVTFYGRLFFRCTFIHYFAHGSIERVWWVTNAIICYHHNIST